MNLNKLFAFMLALISCVFVGCADSEVAGGSSDDAGIYAVKGLDVAGVSQKGPFVTGSVVSVQGVDCKTLELTGEKFTGNVKSDKGDFAIDGVNLKSSCALFEVTGYYLNEVTGKESSDKLSLKALTDLSVRKTVNVNLLTHLEYERLKHLVTVEKMDFAAAKAQAEREVLTSFDIANNVDEFENLNIFEKGDGNAALLAVSVLMQADADVAKLEERTNEVSSAIAKNGLWDDDETKSEVAEWVAAAKENGQIEKIRQNLESLNYASEIPAFETYVESFGESLTRESFLNPQVQYDSIVDNRDGQVYKTVKIGEQVWMAQNLNYIDTAKAIFKDSSWCYDNNPRNCALAGRLYTWTVAKDSLCPEGYHLPDTTEWNTLFASVGGTANAGTVLRSILGWDSVDGTNDYGFSAVAVGERYHSGSFDSEGTKAFIWTATALPEESENSAYAAYFVENATVSFKKNFKDNGASVRCLKDTF
ncbi:fibrobacter succinogenes major paralogous domain-containing protein [Fibrobacter sp.]|uniref:fibrobacter succinogenes major paralogous domain-containing protein n=1 Tax=Fibrobacter sp. TaxID=35828 RepID=UPI0025BA9F85|nr:fibrobacter succinogenes major paralogous domain-containing protein [Fibrobacter sp.]MBR3071472.1 fibrobacter succinogenes major paralogous domain-containing protein [Fibrobacter sp.]